MKRMLLPYLALTIVLSATAQAATLQSVLNCSGPNAAVAINEAYAVGSSGYMTTGAAATVKDRFQNSIAAVTTNSFGAAGSPTVMILTADKTAIMIIIPRRTFLSFEQNQVKAKMVVDNGRSEEAVCSVRPVDGPRASE